MLKVSKSFQASIPTWRNHPTVTVLGWCVSLAVYCSASGIGQTWEATRTPIKSWLRVASSADGTKLAATARGGFVYTSTDSGATWRTNNLPAYGWASIASSADGNKLVTVARQQLGHLSAVYASTNAGALWFDLQAPSTNWGYIASSADGTKLVATAQWGYIFISTNAGAAWSQTASPTEPWQTVACSADGNIILAAGFAPDYSPSRVAVSTNAGSTWTVASFAFNPTSVACSAGGDRMMVTTAFGGVYFSTNFGVLWNLTSLRNNNNDYWSGLACSADGTRWAAGISHSYNDPTFLDRMFLSSDSGISWVAANAPTTNWNSIASSADGSKWVAVVGDLFGQIGPICTRQSVPTPELSITATGTNLVLSWVMPSRPFSLQQSSDPISGNWVDPQVPPTLNYSNLRYKVTAPASAAAAFYRLVSE